MTSKTDVVVIGAGSIGVNSAYFLAEQGYHVTLLDKDDVCDSHLYESNIHPITRFIHERDIQPVTTLKILF